MCKGSTYVRGSLWKGIAYYLIGSLCKMGFLPMGGCSLLCMDPRPMEGYPFLCKQIPCLTEFFPMKGCSLYVRVSSAWKGVPSYVSHHVRGPPYGCSFVCMWGGLPCGGVILLM